MAAVVTQQWNYSTSQGHVRSASSSGAVKMQSSSSSSRKHADMYDRFYGHREISELSESVISALFACPLDSTSSSVNAPVAISNSQTRPTPRLAEFIAYALHRTRLPDEITFQALFLLRRLKSRFPAARGSSGHRLFISALMLASKSSCDDTYSNKSWTIVSQGLFSLREVNQMERELFGYLGYKVNVEYEELEAFTSLLQAGEVATVVDLSNGTTAPSSPMVSDDVTAVGTSQSVDTTPTKIVQQQYPQAPVMSRHHSAQHRARASMSAIYSRASSSAAVSPTTVPAMASASAPSVCATDSYASMHPAMMNAGFATTQAARGTFTMQQQQNIYGQSQPGLHHLSPSMASLSSSRGSISSVGGYSMTPSPTGLSHSESSNSSRASPDTPPAEFEASPWTDDGKASFSGEPAGTYDDEYQFYHHNIKQQQQQNAQQQYYGTVAGQQVYIPDVHPAYQH